MARLASPVVLFLLLLTACGPTAEQEAAKSLSVEDVEFLRNREGDRQLRGRVVNPTDQAIGALQVEIGLYDANNRQVETVQIPLDAIQAQSDTNFSFTLDTDEEFRGARVKGIRLF